ADDADLVGFEASTPQLIDQVFSFLQIIADPNSGRFVGSSWSIHGWLLYRTEIAQRSSCQCANQCPRTGLLQSVRDVGRLRKPRIATKSADPMIDQMIGNCTPPTSSIKSSGNDMARASHMPSRAPMNP